MKLIYNIFVFSETLELAKYGLDGGGILPKLGILPEITDIPKKIIQRVVDFTNSLPYNFNIRDVEKAYCKKYPKSKACAARRWYCKKFPWVPSCKVKKICGPICLRKRYCKRHPYRPSCLLFG